MLVVSSPVIPPLASSDVSYRYVRSDRESIVCRWVIRGDLIATLETEYPVSHRIPPEYSGRINVVVGMGMGMGCVGLSMVLRSDLIFRWDRMYQSKILRDSDSECVRVRVRVLPLTVLREH